MQHQQHISQPKAEAPVAGKPVKRRVLGESGWIQVTTDKGLKYYINAQTKETTWIAPEAALIWIERRKAEKLQEKQLLKKQQETERKLTEEEQLQQWVETTKALIESKQIPPIMTYDRAQARLCVEAPFLQIPSDRRQEVFELAKKAIVTKGASLHLLEGFKSRVEALEGKNIIRQDHTVEVIWDTYFREDKWCGLRKNEAANQILEDAIQRVQEKVSAKLETLMPAFQDFVSRCFQAYVSKAGDTLGKSVQELLDDNEFVIAFTSTTSLDDFKSFVQSVDIPERREQDLIIWGEFLMSLEPDLINELLIDTWQNWCQHQWQAAAPVIETEREATQSHDNETKAPSQDSTNIQGEQNLSVNIDHTSNRMNESEDGALSESTEETNKKKGGVPRPARVENRVSCMADRLKKRPLENGSDETLLEKRRRMITAEASLTRRKELLIEMFDTIKDPYQYLDSRTFHNASPPSRKQMMGIQECLLSHILMALERNEKSRWPELEIDLIRGSNRCRIQPRLKDGVDLPRQLILDYNKIKLCFEQWLQTWLNQRKHQLSVLMSESSNLDLSNLYRAINHNPAFDHIVKKVPRFILDQWLEDLREEMLEDLLSGFENFLRSNPQLSQLLSKLDSHKQDNRELLREVKDAIREESIYKRLACDRERRDDSILKFLDSYNKARESSHHEAMRLLDKKSAASQAAQDDYEKNKIRLEDSVAEREEDLFLLGAGDEEL